MQVLLRYNWHMNEPTQPLPDGSLPKMSPLPVPTAVAPALPPPEVALDDEGNLADELPCRRCGYVLRGLPLEGRCPECGTAVGWSVHGDLLRFSDPGWADHLAGGALWLIVASLGAIVAGILGSLLGARPNGDVAPAVLSLIVSCISVVGHWRVTMADPGQPEHAANLRLWTRILAVVGASAPIVTLIGVFVASTAGGIALGVAMFGSMVAGLIGTILLYIIMRRLARRIPNEPLARQTTVVMIGTAVGGGVTAVGGAAAVLLAAAGMGSGMTTGVPVIISAVGACTGLVTMLVFWIWWVVLLFIYRNALKRESGYARATWMAAQ